FRDKHSGSQGPHNGFYTQEELKDLIRYADNRHVEIIPELDIPGHTAALIQVYPVLGCAHMDSIPVRIGKTTDRTLCAAQDKVYEFYNDVLQEVCTLFPSKRIHLGGDEAVIDKNWGHCPDCQKLMEIKGFKEVREIMGYFFGKIHEMVKQHQKELMLWCELDNIRLPAHEFLFPYPKDCTLFTWRMGLTPKTIELTRQAGIKLIASPGEHCYLDYPQYKGDLPEYNNWGMPILTLQQSYDWDPGYGLPTEQQEHIIGIAGLLWAEAMQDMNRVTYMAYPRAIALAEAGWSMPENRNWEDFKTNLIPHLSELLKQGISFRTPFELYQPH
ncbi:MAG: family 20 glycosylhydrolase, partial [Odoribacter sp.]|nr:family 20 glycosylhydrolase [Odoribacter sp.]